MIDCLYYLIKLLIGEAIINIKTTDKIVNFDNHVKLIEFDGLNQSRIKELEFFKD